MRRLIVANFDCELDFAKNSSPGPHKALPESVRAALGRVAPALAVLGTDDDFLWTMSSHPRQGKLRERTGDLAALSDYDAVLPWGQSTALPAALAPPPWQPDATWQEQLWQLRTTPHVAAACNDRRLCLALDVDPLWTLPEREAVASLDALDQFIAQRELGPDDTWVAKAPWAAAGRERVRRRGRVLEGEMRVRTRRLLERYGELLIEGWMPRVADYGVAGVIGETLGSIVVFAPHQLHSDETGVFRGIRIADSETRGKLGEAFHQALQGTANSVAQALHERGYRGPFGIDAFVYTDKSGAKRLQSLCEINARLCFGLVARAQAEKLGLSTFDFSF